MLKHILNDDAYLRLLEESDAHEMFAVIDGNREHLRKYLPFVEFTHSPNDCLSFIRSTRKQIADNQGLQCAIIDQGRLVGMIGVHAVNWLNKSTTIGYWLAADAQGKGLMTAAVKAMVDYAFHSLQLHLVEIRAAVENTRSQAVPQRLGFKREAVLREREWLHDRYVDHVVFSITASEWT